FPATTSSAFITSPHAFWRLTAMTDWPGALARAFQQHLAGGSGGSAGSHRGFDRPSRGIESRDPGTSSPNPLVPVVPETNPLAAHAALRTTATTAHSRMVSGQGR